MATEHNLCEVYSRVKNACENKDITAINQLANKEWRDRLFSVFLKIEKNQIDKINNMDKPVIIDKSNSVPPPPPSTTMDVDNNNQTSSEKNKDDTIIQTETIKSQQTKPTITITSTVSNEEQDTEIKKEKNENVDNNDNSKNNKKQSEEKNLKTPSPTQSKSKPPTLTPRLSTASLSTLPPSIDDEDNQRYHPLEFIFMIILECCREHTTIKSKKKPNRLRNKNSVKARFEQIRSTSNVLMQHSLAQLLGTFPGQRPTGNIQLCMMFLSKEFIDKTVSMLEYDPVRRAAKRQKLKLNMTSTTPKTASSPKSSSPPKLKQKCMVLPSYKHRNFLKYAKPKTLDGITLMEQEDLYEEIEFVYKLTYVRDVVLLGKLDLEQQAYHILNHHINRYNSVICETIVEDHTFLQTLFRKIKESCSKNYDIIPSNQLLKSTKIDNDEIINTQNDDTPILTPNTPSPHHHHNENNKENQEEIKNNDNNDIENMEISRSISRTVSIDDDTSSSPSTSKDDNLMTNSNETESFPKIELNVDVNQTKKDDASKKMEIDDKTDNDDNDNKCDKNENDESKEEYNNALKRREINRPELFDAPDGILFRFLSELLSRTKMINDPQSRSQIFRQLIENGLLDTLTICIQSDRVLPTYEFSHIWLILVESLHHLISVSPCGQQPQVRSEICKQIQRIYNNKSHNGHNIDNIDNNENKTENTRNEPKTLLQRLCGAFSTDYICHNDGILDQIYYIITGILGLGELMGLEGAQSLSYISLGGNRNLQSEQLKKISRHFFDECVPLFYRVLSGSQRYTSYNNNNNNHNSNKDKNKPSYKQIKTIQKYVINLLTTCCEQEQFIDRLKDIERKYNLMSSIHNLIYIPRNNYNFNNNNNSNKKNIPNKDLSLCCIRYLRECMHLAQHDKFWSNRIKDNGLFRNILDLFNYNGLNRYNMINSTILSIFASIEEKKIEEIIIYLGDEKILNRYAQQINYTTKFEDLIELYEKAKSGVSISQTLDEQSTATLSNCDSLSPRMSPSGLSPNSLLHNGWSNGPTKEEIHYFDDHDDDDDDDGDISYVLDDGPTTNNIDQKDHEEEEHENDHNSTKPKNGAHSNDDEEDIDMNHNHDNNDNNTRINGNTPPNKIIKNGLSGVYKDSPRPIFGNHKQKELKLPIRRKQNEFDLLGNANSKLKKKGNKLNLNIFNNFSNKNKNDNNINTNNHKDDGNAEKETSPFLDTLTNAMCDNNNTSQRKSTKRKFKEISNDADNTTPTVTTTSSYIANNFEVGPTLSSSDGIHENLSDPPKKRVKYNANGGTDIYDHNHKNHAIHPKSNGINSINDINASPDTFDTQNDDIDIHYHQNQDHDTIMNGNGSGNGNVNHTNTNHNRHQNKNILNGHSSILLNGDDSNHSNNNNKINGSPKNKHVHFKIAINNNQNDNIKNNNNDNNNNNNNNDIEMSASDIQDDFSLHSQLTTTEKLSPQSAVCQS